MSETKTEPEREYLRTREVAARIGITRRTLMYWLARGRFVDPDIIGESGNWHFWHKNTIDRWIRQHGGK